MLNFFTDTIEKVPDYFKKVKLLFVTNIEVYNYLQNTRIAHKISYVPLYIINIYYVNNTPLKTIDVLQMGRQNTILHNWMVQVTEQYPHIEYVYLKENAISKAAYYSTIKGWMEQSTDTRAGFMQLLGDAKISLLSAPSIDGGEKRTGGYNPVTPRFYESAINNCYMIGKFPDAPDFIHNNISRVCERPFSYEEFEVLVLQMLAIPFNKQNVYNPFIKEHLTSTIAVTIQNTLESIIE